MRRHHHDFAEQKNIQMITHYNQEYNKEFSKEDLKQGSTKEQLMEKALELRKSHIMLGKEQLPLKSIHQSDFAQKPVNGIQKNTIELQKSHFQLGDGHDVFIYCRF